MLILAKKVVSRLFLNLGRQARKNSLANLQHAVLHLPVSLLGSVLGKSVMHMLMDHKAEIDYRYVDRVILVGKKDVQPDKVNGLPLAIDTGRSLQLDLDHTDDKDLGLYAFAVVIHVWQIICIRMQHGELPPEEVDISLTLTWTSYFLSAHSLVKQHIRVAQDELRYAVQYWENRLKCVGYGNQWITNRWAENISTVNQDLVFYRNETADRYLKAFEKLGKEGITIAIIEEEKKGEPTQLRTMTQEPPEGMKMHVTRLQTCCTPWSSLAHLLLYEFHFINRRKVILFYD